jgi:hypothetical protein
VARRGNGYDRTTNDDDANDAQALQRTYQTRGRDFQYNAPQYYYRERPYYGRSLFFPNGW